MGPDARLGPRGAPPPPDWLRDIRLPMVEHAAGTKLYRVHRRDRDPVFFGPPGSVPESRFDAPAGEFRTLYVGLSPEAAFVETLLRNPGLRLVDGGEVEARRLSVLACDRPLRAVALHGEGLSRVGTDAGVFTGPYRASRAWALALFGHPDAPDAIEYPSRHDPGRLCLALFARAELRPTVAGGPDDFDRRWLAATLKRYGKALV